MSGAEPVADVQKEGRRLARRPCRRGGDLLALLPLMDGGARTGWRLDEARLAFEKMLTHANHVGLYAEEIGPTGEQLGNFP